MTDAAPELLSIREFARRDGCNDKLVRTAVKNGKLLISQDGKLSAALVGTGWRRNNRRAADGADVAADVAADLSAPAAPAAAAPPVAPLPDLAAIDDSFLDDLQRGVYPAFAQSERIKEAALAAKHLLDAKQKSGELIALEDAEAALFESARRARDAWSNWPSRVAPLMAADLGIELPRLLDALTDHVHRQLIDLGEPSPEFTGE